MGFVETPPKDKATILAEERTDLALQRTQIAGERTLMAWIRTALSMIGSGFALYKFFQYLPEEIASGNIRKSECAAKFGVNLDCARALWDKRAQPGSTGVFSRPLGFPIKDTSGLSPS